jgi:hypothetical protein
VPTRLPLGFVARAANGVGEVLASSISWDGHALAMVRERVSEPGYGLRIVEHDGERQVRMTSLMGEVSPDPIIQSFPGGDLLVVDRRCATSRDGVPESNARVYGAAGELRRAFTLGDGIAHALVDDAGTIWVGYFDEGIYGDSPISASGVARFDASGDVRWSYEPPEGLFVDDCYCLNVSGQDVWTSYYSGFPIVHIHDQAITGVWRNVVIGARALAVANDRVLLVGGYRDDHNRAVLLELAADGARESQRFTISTRDNTALQRATIVGRGPFLDILDGSDWYRLDVRQL